MLKIALIFNDNMVLQRDKKILIWGQAAHGEKITVCFQNQISTGVADENGNWNVGCGPFAVCFGSEMTVAGESETKVFTNVQVGEVWLAGGQSNMEFFMKHDADVETEKAVCRNNNIRFFDYPEISYLKALEEADYLTAYGFWRKASPEELDYFSAVGYWFAKELYEKYQVPIGIVGCNWGGTPIISWMSREAICAGGGQMLIDGYESEVSKLDMTVYEKKVKTNPWFYRTDIVNDSFSNMLLSGYGFEEIDKALKETGRSLEEVMMETLLPMGPYHEQRPGGCYESMLMQLAGYAIKGVIWYQGESDSFTYAHLYQTLLTAMIQNWRKLWQEELPFLVVQLPPFRQWGVCSGEHFADIRAAQQKVSEELPWVWLTSASDVGMECDIHPKKKRPVGYRLALLAENHVYGNSEILCEAPVMDHMSVERGKVTIYFRNAYESLYLADKDPCGNPLKSTEVEGLQIIQKDRIIDGKELKTIINKDEIVILSDEIADETTIIKYAQTDWYTVNLYNSAGIPAVPGVLS